MMEYTFRADYRDGTFDVVTVTSESLGDADAQVRDDPEVERALLCSMRDLEPQVALAFLGEPR